MADDSVTTRTLEKAILEEAGYEVRLAADGHQAWRILQKEAIDLVVADVEMPGMDGFTLTETLRHSTALPADPGRPGHVALQRQGPGAGPGGGSRRLHREERLRPQQPPRSGGPAPVKRIRVLVVDDSPTSRLLLVAILRADDEIEVVGQAADGLEAVEMVKRLRPDIVTMDVQMPRLDGFAATKRIMVEAPTPILITTSVDPRALSVSLEAVRVGALAVQAKPGDPLAPGFDEEARELVRQVKAMSRVKVVRHYELEPARGRRRAAAVPRRPCTTCPPRSSPSPPPRADRRPSTAS